MMDLRRVAFGVGIGVLILLGMLTYPGGPEEFLMLLGMVATIQGSFWVFVGPAWVAWKRSERELDALILQQEQDRARRERLFFERFGEPF